jgi:hypothetical protein
MKRGIKIGDLSRPMVLLLDGSPSYDTLLASHHYEAGL